MRVIREVGKRYMDKISNRGYWFRPRARERRVLIECTRDSDGVYYVHRAKAKYKVGRKVKYVTLDTRMLKKEIDIVGSIKTS